MKVDEDRISEVKERYAIGTPYVFSLLSREARKNHQVLLEAFRSFNKRERSHALVIGGDIPSSIRKGIMSTGETDQILITGYIPEADLPYLYTGADAFVFPSLAEGFGLPVLEAMSLGVPVIAADIGAIKEVAGESALFFDPREPEDLVRCLKKVLPDPAVRQDLGTRGLERSTQFSWQKAARTTIALYQELYDARTN